ncbi:hypothetical protein ILUMI_17018 [Ignelater luminosus]|uniref:Uncharacterized protein n=1 Tax=Ignelater luminosus TaxID=2038154 RepID=A0A8K0G2A8_IGNLU|nr:hypothetical protein ILUMI_17018 [Ignelater luminosus]
MIYEDDPDVEDIFIEPPDQNVLTDEDSEDEDSGGFLDNFNRQQQLSAKAEIRLRNKNTEENENTENIESPELSAEFTYKTRRIEHTIHIMETYFLRRKILLIA